MLYGVLRTYVVAKDYQVKDERTDVSLVRIISHFAYRISDEEGSYPIT